MSLIFVLLGLVAAEADQPVNVVVFVSDTLRADALQVYGGPAATPHLSALAARGTLFERMFASGPWTLPSTISLFTGTDSPSYSRPGLEGQRELRDDFFYVPDEEVLLTEILAEKGYRVVASVESPLVAQPNTLQGVDSLERDADACLARLRERAPDLAGGWRVLGGGGELEAVEFLLGAGEQPFFLLIWVLDPHAEYSPADGFQPEFSPQAAQELSLPVEKMARLGHRPVPGLDLRDFVAECSEEDRLALHSLYHGEVESVDARVGRVLAALEQRGLTENTVFAFTSDHGEGFGEHGRFLHGNSFYQELMHIPWILAGPGVEAGVRRTDVVSHIDVVPTLSEALGIEPPPGVQGRSALRPSAASPPLARYLASPFRQRLGHALIQWPYKLIDQGRRLELYHLGDDPREEHDLARSQGQRVKEMRALLRQKQVENEARRDANFARTREAELEGVADATREKLRELGYIE